MAHYFMDKPGYWGKTFYCWPPDPRFDTTANLTSPNATKPGFDTAGKAMCDWRRHFFTKGGTAFAPQGSDVINGILLNSTVGGLTTANTTTWSVNYPAVLKWLKTGPSVLPPNLRAGRVLFYSSIPDDVDTNTGSTQVISGVSLMGISSGEDFLTIFLSFVCNSFKLWSVNPVPANRCARTP